MKVIAAALLTLWVATGQAGSRQAAAPGPSPIILVDTSRGSFAIETFPTDAPRTVAHIMALVRAGFYDGQRVHRAVPEFVVQFGDPRTRSSSLQASWGRGPAASSGTPIGAAEFSKRRLNGKGAVGVAHQGNPAAGDSQIYITLAPRPDLDGRYVVFGQVIDGEEVPARLQVGDDIVRVSIRP